MNTETTTEPGKCLYDMWLIVGSTDKFINEFKIEEFSLQLFKAFKIASGADRLRLKYAFPHLFSTVRKENSLLNPDKVLAEVFRTLSLAGERNIRIHADGYLSSRNGNTHSTWEIKNGEISLFHSEEKTKPND